MTDDEGILVPTDEHSESPKHYTILLHPQPDEMTFDQCLMHVRRTMYWDYLDGYWCDISLYPLKKWRDMLEKQLKAAHEREMDALREENKELLCKLMTLESEFMDWIGQYDPTDAYVRKAQEENGKLRDLVLDYDKMLEIALKCESDDTAPLDDAVHITLRSRMHKLGIEPEQ